MEDMWKSRRKPVPLSFDELINAPSASDSNGAGTQGLRDQRVLTVKDSFDLFVQR